MGNEVRGFTAHSNGDPSVGSGIVNKFNQLYKLSS